MKVMMFCVFWHKTTSTEIWWNREKWKIVELTPLIDTIGFSIINIGQKTQKASRKTCSITKNTTQHLNFRKYLFFRGSALYREKIAH